MKTTVKDLLHALGEFAPNSLQENYDNSGLLCGNPDAEIKSVLTCLDITPLVIGEAKRLGANVLVAHHPLIFNGLRRIEYGNWLSDALTEAIRSDIALIAVHTNLDNVPYGVNAVLAEKLRLKNTRVLAPLHNRYLKVVVFCPESHSKAVMRAAWDAGAGKIGAYDQCSFRGIGKGTFRAGLNTNPFVGEKNEKHTEVEERIEFIVPDWKIAGVRKAVIKNHPYEEVAMDIYRLDGSFGPEGAGMIGQFEQAVPVGDFLNELKAILGFPVLRHTNICKKHIKTVAWCGGSGFFLLEKAKAAGADIFITGDIKYHEFFDADNRIILVDAGHYETEQFTPQLLANFISGIFTTFATRPTELNTNPILYH